MPLDFDRFKEEDDLNFCVAATQLTKSSRIWSTSFAYLSIYIFAYLHIFHIFIFPCWFVWGWVGRLGWVSIVGYPKDPWGILEDLVDSRDFCGIFGGGFQGSLKIWLTLKKILWNFSRDSFGSLRIIRVWGMFKGFLKNFLGILRFLFWLFERSFKDPWGILEGSLNHFQGFERMFLLSKRSS